MEILTIFVSVYNLIAEIDTAVSLIERLVKILCDLNGLEHSKYYKVASKALEYACDSKKPEREIGIAINNLILAYEDLSDSENRAVCYLIIATCYKYLHEEKLKQQFVKSAVEDFTIAWQNQLSSVERDNWILLGFQEKPSAARFNFYQNSVLNKRKAISEKQIKFNEIISKM